MESNRELFETYNKEVFRTCYYMLHDAGDAEDLCQEVFIIVMRSRWLEVQYLRAWIMKIAVNTCLNHLKRRKRLAHKTAQHAFLFTENESTAPETIVEEREQAERMAGYLNTLPAKIRAVLTLRYMHEFSLAEIAEALSIPLGTAKSRQHKGLKMMKELLRDYRVPEDERRDGVYGQAGKCAEAATK